MNKTADSNNALFSAEQFDGNTQQKLSVSVGISKDAPEYS